MAVYKVPQDVEAEDKLLGPFSFRQFIYLMIAGGAVFIGVMLFQAAPFLIIIPLPVIIFFGALALPLRKDQPMETYLIALIRFYLKPKRRLWDPDGTITYVEITAPKILERRLTKDLSEQAAEERLDYLSRVMDSRGWALKGVDRADAGLTPTVAAEAADTPDVLDEQAELAKSFDDLIAKKKDEEIGEAKKKMQQARTTPDEAPKLAKNPYEQLLQNQQIDQDTTVAPHFNPYPTIHQRVIQPGGTTAKVPPQKPPEKTENKPESAGEAPVSPDIMRLARTKGLTISAIAREAHRLQEGDEGEVVITLH